MRKRESLRQFRARQLAENTRLRNELSEVARGRDQMIATLATVRAELEDAKAARTRANIRIEDMSSRLRRLMDAALSGDPMKLHYAVAAEVRGHWQRQD